MDYELIKLYDGKVEVKFFPKTHCYMVNGTRAKSVTGIIGLKDKSGALVPWALEEGAKSLLAVLESGKKITEESIVKSVFASQEAKEKAADLGTAIHDWIEQYIKAKISRKPIPDMPEDRSIIIGVNSFLEWESAHKVQFKWAEKLLYSKKYGYVGKADFAAKVDGKLCLCDNKTGNGLYEGVWVQTAAYQKADEEESGVKYEGRWAIRISKETEKEYYARMELKNKIKTFLGKKPVEVKPYEIFEAKFLDETADTLKEDFTEFLHRLAMSGYKRGY